MVITYFIGNGFDLAFGAKTRYSDFYKSCDDTTKSKLMKEIMDSFKKGDPLWSDFEEALCKNYIQNIDDSNSDEFIDDLRKFKNDFSKYLKREEQSVLSNESLVKRNIDIANETIYCFNEFLLVGNKQKIYNRYGDNCFDTLSNYFIIFNYTNIASIFIGTNSTRLSDIGSKREDFDYVQIHGDNDPSNMVLGYSEEEYIDYNMNLKDALVKTALCKSNYYNGRLDDDIFKANNMIERSKIIVIFGMSIGDSDSYWWKTIIKKIIKDQVIIIYYLYLWKEIQTEEAILERKKIEEKIRNLCLNMDLSKEEYEIVKNNFLFENSSKIFNETVLEKRI